MIKLNHQKNEEKTENEFDRANKNINVVKAVSPIFLGVASLALYVIKKGAISTVKRIIFKS